MDVFSRTFLPAAAEAGVAIPTVSRHMPIFRRCVEADDADGPGHPLPAPGPSR